MKQLLENKEIDVNTPVFYAFGITDYEDYGLEELKMSSRTETGEYNPTLFINEGMKAVSPLTQFQVLYNMPVCFLSIELGFTGDNSVVYHSVSSLLQTAQFSGYDGKIIIAAGKRHGDGSVSSGCALISVKEIEKSEMLNDNETSAIDFFKQWNSAGVMP